jgi:hypothetical protein
LLKFDCRLEKEKYLKESNDNKLLRRQEFKEIKQKKIYWVDIKEFILHRKNKMKKGMRHIIKLLLK